MAVNLQSVTGTHDITPAEMVRWQGLRQTAERIATRYGYAPIETPLIEPTELFLRAIGKSTDIVNKEMFTFQPRGAGSDTITLRPEGTASVCRAYLQGRLSEAPQPVRLYYLGPMFRYERPQKGRYRQFHQFGVEVIGSDAAPIDAEIIELAYEFVRGILPSDKKLQVLVNSLGTPQDRAHYSQQLQNYYAKYENELPDEALERLRRSPLRMLDALPPRDGGGDPKLRILYELSENAPRAIDGLSDEAKRHFDEVCELLSVAQIQYEIDHKMVRGLDYYTKTVFEIGEAGFQASRQATLLGGGRYDGLMELLGGKPTPAAGFAVGLERVLEFSMLGADAELPFLAVVYAEGETARAYGLARGLRAVLNDKKIVFAPQRSLKSQMRYANKLGARFALIVGSKAGDGEKVFLKDLTQTEDTQIELEADADKIATAIKGFDKR